MRSVRFRLPQPISIDAIKFHNDGVSPTRNNRSGLKRYQDQRNPYYYEYDDDKEEENTLTCMCSNCVNGKSDLANYILQLLDSK